MSKLLREYGLIRHLVHGEEAVRRLPETSALAGRIIASWNEIEWSLNQLVAQHMLTTDYQVASELLLEIRNWRKRLTIIRACAEYSLSEEHANLVKRASLLVDPVARRRNEIAHHIWAALRSGDEYHLVLIDPEVFWRDQAARRQGIASASDEAIAKIRATGSLKNLEDHARVHTTKDLEADLEKSRALKRLLDWVQILLNKGGDATLSAQLDRELPALPENRSQRRKTRRRSR